MNSFNIRVVMVLQLVLFLSACNLADWSPINKSPEFLRHPDGQIIRQCDGSGIAMRGGAREKFWRDNDLPKGTINFVCKNGKAYLPDQVPKN